jgi:hypothetical protein
MRGILALPRTTAVERKRALSTSAWTHRRCRARRTDRHFPAAPHPRSDARVGRPIPALDPTHRVGYAARKTDAPAGNARDADSSFEGDGRSRVTSERTLAFRAKRKLAVPPRRVAAPMPTLEPLTQLVGAGSRCARVRRAQVFRRFRRSGSNLQGGATWDRDWCSPAWERASTASAQGPGVEFGSGAFRSGSIRSVRLS